MFEQTSVNQLRAALVGTGRFTEEQANAIKGKANLVYELKKLEKDGFIQLSQNLNQPAPQKIEESRPQTEDDTIENMLNMAEVDYGGPIKVEEGNISEVGMVQTSQLIPQMTSPEWQDYVLGQLTENEFFKGNPKVCGLRRVAEKLLGEIIFNGPTTIYPATNENMNGRASVLYKIEIAWKFGCAYVDIDKGLPTRVFTSCAEGWDGNIQPGIYQTFPLTIAETRAEGRALRKALMLSVVTAEEVQGELPSETTPVVEGWNGEDKASSQQLNSLNMLSERCGVDYGKLVPDVTKLTRQKAVELLKELNSYQSGTAVPTSLKA